MGKLAQQLSGQSQVKVAPGKSAQGSAAKNPKAATGMKCGGAVKKMKSGGAVKKCCK